MINDHSSILSVKGLSTWFSAEDGMVKAVDDVSFELQKGETLGILGESGSGKSVASLSIMRLISSRTRTIVGGSVVFEGGDILKMSEADVRRLRGRRIAMIFQDPMTSLHPFLRIATQLTEVTRLHLGHTRGEARRHAAKMLNEVGIPDAERHLDSYPHQLSGGMRQRVMIAMALSCDPDVLIADEPTTALDVTIQAQILDLIRDLQVRMGTSVILVTHDLGVVAGMADRVIVMYAGRIFEQAATADLFRRPSNPYTRALLKCVPDPARPKVLEQIPGSPPDLAHLGSGCPFAERCDQAEEVCRTDFPPFVKVDEGHYSLCHFARDEYEMSGVRESAS